MPKVLAVVSVTGQDQKGAVARFATFLAERAVNLEDLQQHVVRGLFVMDILADLSELSVSLDELIKGLSDIGNGIGMQVRVTLESQRKPKQIAVLVSKEPHCLEKLISMEKEGQLTHGKINCVLANHDTLRPISEEAGLSFEYMPSTDKPAHMAWLRQTMIERNIDVVVLARYMQILTPDVVQAFPYKIINIHPSLLPHFPGSAPYKQAYEQGVRVSGCTAHFVTEDLDEGPIILQDVFHIDVGRDTPSDVRRKGIDLESEVLSKAVGYFLNDQLVVVDETVVFKPGLSSLLEPQSGG